MAGAAMDGARSACVAPGQWGAPGSGGVERRTTDQVFAEFARQQVVLLGETHEDAEHHRWQLHTIAGLHALRHRLVLGFEMFPRRVQPVLNDWVAGRLDEATFLQRSEWSRVWGFDFHLYLPIFQFARMHRIPMLALNVERQLVTRVGDEGWAAIPVTEREGVSDPAPPSETYVVRLHGSYLDHQPPGGHQAVSRKPPSEEDLKDPKFRRFVEAMQLWDRAMAQRIVEAARGQDAPLVVAIMGSGHVRNGDGVPRQLRDLGVNRFASALPWDTSASCDELAVGIADVVFGVESRPEPARPARPRLGISIDADPAGVLVRSVVPGSIAEQAGIRAGDIILRIAGESAARTENVVEAVQRQAPGTWLPLTVKRGEETVEIVARFPPRK
jgi:uncharacterized iron-regulated protein